MKRATNDTDDKIRKLFKEQLPYGGTTDNEWFTRKVLNRLPPKQSRNYNWITIAVYIISLFICSTGWVLFIFSRTPGLLLVKDLVGFVILLSTTIILLWHVISSLLHFSET